MLNYLRGVRICENNSNRLATSGQIIINDNNGTNAFGLFLLYIAYEEMAKAIFCFFIHKGWITPQFANQVFKDHKPKIFLLDEFFQSFELRRGVPHLGGNILGQITLNKFIVKHKQKIKDHRDITNQLLYVNKNGNWHIPVRDIKNFSRKKSEIETKTSALATVLNALQMESNEQNLNNFRLVYAKKGRITISYSTRP